MNETVAKNKKLDIYYDFDDDDPIHQLIVKYGIDIVEKCYGKTFYKFYGSSFYCLQRSRIHEWRPGANVKIDKPRLWYDSWDLHLSHMLQLHRPQTGNSYYSIISVDNIILLSLCQAYCIRFAFIRAVLKQDLNWHENNSPKEVSARLLK